MSIQAYRIAEAFRLSEPSAPRHRDPHSADAGREDELYAAEQAARRTVAIAIAGKLAAELPYFDRERFLDECNVKVRA